MATKTFRDRVIELRRVRAGDLRPNPSQWRVHTKPQVAALQGILAEVGFAGAALAYQDTEGGLTLVDGHMRSGVDPNAVIPVLVLDVDAEEAKKLLAIYDPLAAMATHDQEALLTLLESVKFQDQAVNDLLEALANDNYQSLTPLPPLHEPQPDPGPQLDRAAELQQKWGTARGQIWEFPSKATKGKAHRLMCGDSAEAEDVERLLGEIIPHLMVTDPPYGVAYETDGHNPRWWNDNKPIANDDLGADQESWWLAAFSCWPLVGDAYVFSPSGPLIAALARAAIASGIEHHQWLIWAKDRFALGRSHYHYRHEHIFYGWKGKSSWQGRRDEDSLWEVSRPSTSPDHPTTKPLALIERAIRNSSQWEDVVIDPFLGSGTTLVACERLGRTGRVMEIEPKYIAVALERMVGMGLEPRLTNA